MSAVRWLLVGALGVETLPVLRRLRGARARGARLVTGRLGGAEVAVLTCGVGPIRAERRTAEALAGFPAEAVVSLGTCGALVDELPIGSLVTAGALFREETPAGRLRAAPGIREVGLTTVSEVVWSTARRSRLATLGAAVCEMEAAGVARAAQGRAVYAVKVVSDQAGGAPDPALASPSAVTPAAVALFKLRALRLSERTLAPALERLVREI